MLSDLEKDSVYEDRPLPKKPTSGRGRGRPRKPCDELKTKQHCQGRTDCRYNKETRRCERTSSDEDEGQMLPSVLHREMDEDSDEDEGRMLHREMDEDSEDDGWMSPSVLHREMDEDSEDDGWMSPSVLHDESEEEPVAPPQPTPPFQPSALIRNAIPTAILDAMKHELNTVDIDWTNIFNNPESRTAMFDKSRTDPPDRRVAYGKHPKKTARQHLPELDAWGEKVLTVLATVRPDLPPMHIAYMAYICAETEVPQIYHSDISFQTKTIAFTAFSPINIECPDTEENGSRWIDNHFRPQPMGSMPGDVFFMDGGMLWQRPKHTPPWTVGGRTGEAANQRIVKRMKTATLPSPRSPSRANGSPITTAPSPTKPNPQPVRTGSQQKPRKERKRVDHDGVVPVFFSAW